jgi:hypothetical protein
VPLVAGRAELGGEGAAAAGEAAALDEAVAGPLEPGRFVGEDEREGARRVGLPDVEAGELGAGRWTDFDEAAVGLGRALRGRG